jgi:hypothetical protein
MTEQTAQQPAENVARGTLVALLAIPAAIVAFALVGALFGGVSGIAAIVVPYIAAFLYRFGAGTTLSRAGWIPYIGVTAAAIVIGTVGGIASGTWSTFSSVGGKGGILGSAFWRTVGNQFTIYLGDNAVPILIGLVLGAIGIVSVIRGRTRIGGFGRTGGRIAPQDVAEYTHPESKAPAAPPVPPAPNAPSPGIILNGKPLDPDTK